MRLVLAFFASLAANAVALLVAAVALDGFHVAALTFPVLVVVYTAISLVVIFLTDAVVRRHAAAFTAVIGLGSAFLALLITDVVTTKLTIHGFWAWLIGTLIVWLATLVVLPLTKRAFGADRRGRR